MTLAMTNRVPLAGLILAGGKSRRMRRDKALLEYHGKPQVAWLYDFLRAHIDPVYVSVRRDQAGEAVRSRMPLIVDRIDAGPAAGVFSAMNMRPDSAWLVVACDLPFVNDEIITRLLAARDQSRDGTAFISTHDGLPEPLCAIWEPAARLQLEQAIVQRNHCPRKILMNADLHLIEQHDPRALDNINTPEELREVLA